MSIRSWNPMEDVMSFQDTMSRLMEEGMVPARFARRERVPAPVLRLPLDAYATDTELVITASVPGLKPEDVEITLEGDTLTIKGEFKQPLENVQYLMNERLSGSFVRTLTINIPVQADKAEARFEDGVLTLILPKAEEVRPKVIKVQTK
ncbi:MAG: Hsp20/alpha crystallin family protein [Anaerolineales bacterium]|nr:Hsp20/alpha crystallin family protein [Anaerolineales bacterium]